MSADWEDLKTSGSFTNPQDLTFVLWKYKREDNTIRTALKRGGATYVCVFTYLHYIQYTKLTIIIAYY